MRTKNLILGSLFVVGLLSIQTIYTALSYSLPVNQQNPLYFQQEQTSPPDTDPTLPSTPTGNIPTQTSQPPSPTVVEISGYEPHRFQQLEGGLLSIYGTGFSAGVSVRLIGYGVMDTSVLSNQALQCVVPPGLRTGKYELELLLPTGGSVHLPGSITIQAEKTTATPAPSGPSVYAQPQLMIRSATSNPAILQRGEAFQLNLEIENRGSYSTARGQLTLNSPDLALPQTGSNVVILQPMTAGQVVQIPLTLTTDDQAPGGFNNLEILLEYADYYGRSYSSSQTIALHIETSSHTGGLVLLETYHTTPESLSPGDIFDLQLTLRNAGQGRIEQLLVTLGDPAGTGIKPFALLGTGNVFFTETLNTGEAITLEREVIIEGTADAGAYSLPVHIQYEGNDQATTNQVQVLTLLVRNLPQIQVSFYRPVDLAEVGKTIELPIEIMNIGRTSLNISHAEVTADDIEIENGSTFIGSLDGGTSAFLDALATPLSSGDIVLNLSINYLDDFNQAQVITQTLSLKVESPPELVPGPNGLPSEPGDNDRQGGILYLIRGLFGLGS